MKSALLNLLAIIIFVLQISFIPALRPFGVVPDVGLVIVGLVGLYATASDALILAVIGGLILDLVSGTNFGLYVALYTVIALAAGYIHRAGLNWAGPLMAMSLVLVATLIQNIVILGGLVRTAAVWPMGHILAQLVTEIILNIIIVLALRPLVQWLSPKMTSEIEVRS
jgi:rod shape-determining protein MreD